MKHNTHSAPGFDPVISLLIVGAIAVATILAPTTGWSTEGDTT